MDFFELLRMYLDNEITEERVIFLFGEETLQRLVDYITDPFDEVLGG